MTSRWKLPNILWFKQTEEEEKRAQIKESEINATRSTKWANRIEHKNNGVNSKAAVNTKQVKSNLIIVFVCLCVCVQCTQCHIDCQFNDVFSHLLTTLIQSASSSLALSLSSLFFIRYLYIHNTWMWTRVCIHIGMFRPRLYLFSHFNAAYQ